MKRILYYVILMLIGGNGMMMARYGLIHGRVTDMENNPVDGVAVVLQTLHSVYVDAVVTDSLGSFNLDHAAEQTCRLLFQHLLYEPFQLEINRSVMPLKL